MKRIFIVSQSEKKIRANNELAHSLLANLLEREDIFVPSEVGDEIQNVMETLIQGTL